MTGLPSPVVGSACDLDGTGSFQCYPPPNDKALCESCAPTQGVYCAGGMFCLYGVGRCARYCCDDGDCGSGRCWLDAAALFGADLAVVGDEVGACVEKIPDGGTPKPACDAPDVAPSGGTCVVGHPPP